MHFDSQCGTKMKKSKFFDYIRETLKLIKTKMNEMMEYNKYANNDWQTNQIQTYPPKNSHKVYSESKDIEKRFAAQ